jgi:Mg-chelatase subunit ChlD
MRENGPRVRSDDRAVSELVGTTLVIALALVGALVVIGTGTVALNSVNDGIDQQNAQSVLQELDSRFASLASDADAPRVEIDLGSTDLENLQLRRDGYLDLTINGNANCSVNHTLSSVRYSSPQGEQLIYQTGGVWSLSGSSSTTITAPSFDYRDGAVDLTLYNISGVVDKSQTSVVRDIGSSRARSAAVAAALSSGDCVRPNSVQLEIRSPVYAGWATHLEQETGTDVTVFDDNRTVRLSLDQSDLPRKVNDSQNTVVNLSKPAYMTDVQIDESAGTISIDKDAGNNYTVFSEPLTENRLDIGRIRFLPDTANTTRRPLDVVMVLDESGSMSGTKIDKAKDAAQRFIGGLNGSRDRVGIVGYDTDGEYHRVDGNFLTSDFAGANQTIEYDVGAGGGTRISRGVDRSNLIHDFKNNETRDRITIVLTDGVNDIGYGSDECDPDDAEPYSCYLNQETMGVVEHSKHADVTMYTIGLGDEDYIAQPLLKDMADTTGGNYYNAENADQLDDVFDEIRQDVNEQRFVARTPLSTNFTTARGSVVAPQIAGATNLATYGDFTNVNDPTAPSKFSHSFAIGDGEAVHMNATTYNCSTWEEIQQTYTNNSKTYSVVRCADIDESAGVENSYTPSEILLNGDDASSLIDTNPGFWENDINETLTQYPTVTLNGTTGEVSMQSNQAIVIFDLPDSRNADNKLAMLYQIGLSESEATAEGVINVQINRLQIED